MEQIWAPWRLEYVQHADEADECVFCRAAGLPEDEPELVIHRGEVAFVLLNKFPYASGHLMVAPYRHGSAFDDLEEAEALETHRLAVEGIEALRTIFAPEGFNVGWNLGRVAGAGIVDHGHLHVVPRWNGDTNFMPVLADIKVIPEHLLETRRPADSGRRVGVGKSAQGYDKHMLRDVVAVLVLVLMAADVFRMLFIDTEPQRKKDS
jgi:ATP adenylyltransferase